MEEFLLLHKVLQRVAQAVLVVEEQVVMVVMVPQEQLILVVEVVVLEELLV